MGGFNGEPVDGVYACECGVRPLLRADAFGKAAIKGIHRHIEDAV